MSNSIRFLGAAIFTWAAVRAVSLGLVPGMEALAFDARASQSAAPRLPAIEPTPLPAINPVAALPHGIPNPAYGPMFAEAAPYPGFAPYPVYIPMPAVEPARSVPAQFMVLDRPSAPPAEINVYGSSPPFMNPAAPTSAAVGSSANVQGRQSTPSFAALKSPRLPDRLGISGWATMRSRAGSDGLANGGVLGGSQAGLRLLWRVDPHLSASLRASAPVNSQRGAEGGFGIRYQPFAGIPVAATLERRQAFREYGRSAFAIFADGGVYGRKLPWNSTLDGYFQAGAVDFNDPLWFVDGQAAVSRPVWRNLSAGFGIWGGAQPGVTRLDIGPRATMRLGSGMKVHFDYRYKLRGNAVPGSGGVMTLAADF